MNLSVIFLQCLLLFFSDASSARSDLDRTSSDTLILLHVLFRHGNRTPDQVALFPKDPNFNETFQPYGYSQLTKKGKKTEYDIGTYLREAYSDFIPQQYTPNVVEAISTNFKRTKMSLELVLAGLFPPLESDMFERDFSWQPIPFLIDQDQHLIEVPSIKCTNFVRQYFTYLLSKKGREILDSYKDLYDQLSTYSGVAVTTPDDVANIYSTLESEWDYGLTLPDWAEDLFPKIVADAALTMFEFSAATPQLRRLTAGFLLQKIIDDSLAKIGGALPEKRKIFLYSAHDFNIAVVLMALNVFERHMPPYGATIFFEIHNVTGVYGLKLYYQDYEHPEPKLLTIPGCEEFCEHSKLMDLISDNLPTANDVCNYSGELI